MKTLTTNLGVVGIMLISCATLNAQTFTVQSGNWSSPSTWSGGIVPDSTAGSIIINHKITVSTGTLLKVDELILNDTLIIEAGSTLLLSNAFTKAADLQIVNGGLKVFGRLVGLDSTSISGTTVNNTFFYDGSTYEHRFLSVAGTPPIATWSANSNLEITGYRTSKTLNNALWSQSFGNVIYNCPNQTSSIEMAGRLKNIKGNFLIQNTNTSFVRLSLDASNSTTILVGGNLIISGNSRVWFSRAATTSVFIQGDFKVLSTATAISYLTTIGNCDVNVEGNFEMNTTSPLRFASATANGVGIVRAKKSFTLIAGTLDVSGGNGLGMIELNGSSPQTFTSLGSWETGVNLVVNNNAGVDVAGTSKIEGNLVVTAIGKLKLPPTNFTLHGDLTVQSGGSLKTNEGTLTLAGSANQSLALAGDTLHHININKASGTSITFSNAGRLSGVLSILSTNTSVVSNGNLTLLSRSDDGNADAFINTLPVGSSVSGNVTVQRYMSGEGRMYRYISSPVNNVSVDSLMDDFPITGTFNDPSAGTGINSASPSFFNYNETLSGSLGWIAYPSTGLASENFLEVGRGYSAFIREASNATTWDVTGVINQGDIPFPITFTNTTDPANDGWNLIGNPYPSSIDWNAPNGWSKTNIDNGIAVRDNSIGNFLYWDGAIGSLGSGRIAKGQSFWIKTNDVNPQLIIKEAAKTISSTTFYRTKNSAPDFLALTISNAKHSDQTFLRIRDDAKSDYDSLDVTKFPNDFINLSFAAGKIPLAISAIGELDCSHPYPIQLSFAKKTDGSFVRSPIGNYKIEANAFGLFQGSEITLHDHFTKSDFNISSSSYPFVITSDPASFNTDRFSLMFNTPQLSDSSFLLCDSVFCDTSLQYKIELKNLNHNTRYTLSLDDTRIDSHLNQQSDSASIEVETAAFKNGFTTLQITASNLCHSKKIKEFNVWKQPTYPPNLFAVTACNSESITLHSKNIKDVVAYNWFDHNHNLISQTQDSTFTVALQKPTTFYASALFDYGCVSPPSSVYAKVQWFDAPVISEDNGLLYSNYSDGNQWSLDGAEISGANQSTLQPLLTGKYSLTLTHHGCVDSSFYNFTYQNDVCQIFPNPVEDKVQIISPRDEQILQIEVMNSSGQLVKIFQSESNSKSETILITDLASGIYLVKTLTTKGQYKKRVLKK